MKQKLTLSIQPDVVRRVKRLALERKTTVSSLFEDWGRRVLLEESESGGLGDDLRGNWDVPQQQNEADVRLNYLLSKHGNTNASSG